MADTPPPEGAFALPLVLANLRTQIVAEIMKLVRPEPVSLGKPTIDQLERILNSDNPGRLNLAPDGSATLQEQPTTTVGTVVDAIMPIIATALANAPAPSDAAAVAAWMCKARNSVGANEPQDCGWPTCGCDPYADRVLAALAEASGDSWLAMGGAPRDGTPIFIVEWHVDYSSEETARAGKGRWSEPREYAFREHGEGTFVSTDGKRWLRDGVMANGQRCFDKMRWRPTFQLPEPLAFRGEQP